MSQEFVWWKHGVFYQIYPRSFMDSNGDGVGDLQGIIDRLDYVRGLGVDAIWISPFFASPMVDYGYDVSDHKDIHPMFGDMATFDRLLAAAHERNLYVVLDYVPNHTSDQHSWFVESRSSLDNPKRDWYIWKDAKSDGGPPNNWESIFGGPAWQWDEKTQQYYLHSFLKEQPDLNWRNPAVVEAMHDVLEFWLDKGVDGFRMDAVVCCIKHADFPDNPAITEDSPFKQLGFSLEPAFTQNQPEMHKMVRGLRRVIDSYEGIRVMIGEIWLFSISDLIKYYGKNLDEFHIPFNFMSSMLPWNAGEMKNFVASYYAELPAGGQPNFVFGNHDIHRLASRYGREKHRSVGMLLLTLWGIPTMYYGDEIGMEDVEIAFDRAHDPWGKNVRGFNLGRDPERTPMQWDSSPNAGFSATTEETWLPVAGNYREVNVAMQLDEKSSTLNFYKILLKLRREMPALHRGDFRFFEEVPRDLMAYIRSTEAQRVLVIINFGDKTHTITLSSLSNSGKLLLSSQFVKSGEAALSGLKVNPHEGLLLQLL